MCLYRHCNPSHHVYNNQFCVPSALLAHSYELYVTIKYLSLYSMPNLMYRDSL